MAFKIKDFPLHVQKQIRDKLSVPASHVEPDACNEPMGTKKIKRLDTPCCINFRSIRKRLADTDGLSGKAAIDGLVLAGVLQDDTTKQVKKVTYDQEKGKEEKTIIEIFY